MNSRLLGLAALVGCFIALSNGNAVAQVAGSNVVVVDVAEVYKQHLAFNASLEAMTQDVETFKATIDRETQRLQLLAEELKSYDPSSDDFKRLEEQLTADSARLTVFRNQQNREFLEREAKLYFDTYLGISRELSQLSDEYGVTLVLRVDNQQPDAADRQSVLQAVNRNIVYKRPDRDFTEMLIARVNR